MSENAGGAGRNERTGSYLVLLDPSDTDAGMVALQSGAGVAAAEHIWPGDHEVAIESLRAGASVVFEDVGVAVVAAEPAQRGALLAAAEESPAVLAIEPERIVYAVEPVSAPAPAATGSEVDESVLTWGLRALGVEKSTFSGHGVRVAVLDTGFALGHPDFAGRTVRTASFVEGEPVDDRNGHGTHCVGTACGPRAPHGAPRYGVAWDAEIYAGKVLSDQGWGTDSGILAGISWALSAGCRVISMSLGSPVDVARPYSRIYEEVAKRAWERGAVLVAAAGNESRRQDGVRAPVGHPANCPSILAVGALDVDLGVAWFSCAGLSPDGGEVDIAAPGVDVLSAWPGPPGHRRESGTSMATPHVAGVVALLAQARPRATAAELVAALRAGARRSRLPVADVGAGLARVP